MTTRILAWINTNIARAIQSKKDIFTHRKPGAVNADEPKLVWVKMINRHGEFDRALMARAHFNRAMESSITDRKNNFILGVNPAIDSPNYFRALNCLNRDGMARFWHEIDANIKAFDANPKDFQPGMHEQQLDRFHRSPQRQHYNQLQGYTHR